MKVTRTYKIDRSERQETNARSACRKSAGFSNTAEQRRQREEAEAARVAREMADRDIEAEEADQARLELLRHLGEREYPISFADVRWLLGVQLDFCRRVREHEWFDCTGRLVRLSEAGQLAYKELS